MGLILAYKVLNNFGLTL